MSLYENHHDGPHDDKTPADPTNVEVLAASRGRLLTDLRTGRAVIIDGEVVYPQDPSTPDPEYLGAVLLAAELGVYDEEAGMVAKTQAQRQREYQLRHPDRKRAKQARYAAAERIFRERHRDDYRVLCDPATPHHRRYRLAMIALRAKYPQEWKQVLHDTPR